MTQSELSNVGVAVMIEEGRISLFKRRMVSVVLFHNYFSQSLNVHKNFDNFYKYFRSRIPWKKITAYIIKGHFVFFKFKVIFLFVKHNFMSQIEDDHIHECGMEGFLSIIWTEQLSLFRWSHKDNHGQNIRLLIVSCLRPTGTSLSSTDTAGF